MNEDLKKREPTISIIVSVLIASVLWIYVSGEVDPNVNQRFNNIPVAIENLEVLEENNLVLSEDPDYTVDISTYGRISTMYGLKSKITASIDLSDITEKGTYNLNVEISGIPDNVELRNIYPRDISLMVDRISQDERSVEINIEGDPQSDLTVLDYTGVPDKVTISGPEEILKSVDKIVGDVVIRGANDDVRETVELYAVDTDNKVVEGVDISSKTCDVTVRIGKIKTVEIRPELNGQPAEGYVVSEIILDTDTITVDASNHLLDDIDHIKTEEIDIENINSDLEQTVGLVLPHGVNIADGESTVLVKVLVSEIESREYQLNQLDLVNKPENLDVTLPEEINITVRLQGRKEVLDRMTEESITLYLNLEDITSGENNTTIAMEEVEGVTLESITPRSIVVNAQESEENP